MTDKDISVVGGGYPDAERAAGHDVAAANRNQNLEAKSVMLS